MPGIPSTQPSSKKKFLETREHIRFLHCAQRSDAKKTTMG